MKTSKISATEVHLIVENKIEDIILASKNLNPMLTYVKFILTDDKPNGNNIRVPREEFSNLITTGLYMPLKMASGEIADGHIDATPIGVITHLREDKDKIRGIAALWNKERPEDVAYIQERYAEGNPLDLSWELGHVDSFIDDAGVENLTGCVLRATTLVGIPAYQGRTIVTDVESSDNSKEDKDVEKELKALKEVVEELKAKISDLEKTQLTSKDKEKLAQYEELAQFKAKVEKEALRLAALQEIKDVFKAAGLDKDDEFFEKEEDKLLALQETNTLEFVVDQLKDKKEKEEEEDESEDEEDDSEESEDESEDESQKEKNASKKKKGIPNISGDKGGKKIEYSPKELAAALRDRRSKS